MKTINQERAEARKNATDLAKENKVIQEELKNALRAQADMEKSLQKVQVPLTKIMNHCANTLLAKVMSNIVNCQ